MVIQNMEVYTRYHFTFSHSNPSTTAHPDNFMQYTQTAEKRSCVNERSPGCQFVLATAILLISRRVIDMLEYARIQKVDFPIDSGNIFVVQC